MSDESNDSSDIIQVVKLTTGEEIVGILVSDNGSHYELSFPARIDVHYGKGPEGMTEFVKLSNYAASITGYKVNIAHTATIFIGDPNNELKIMYMTYCQYMRDNPQMIISSAGEDSASAADQQGLELLNELFNNSDFVEFVNDLIESYENSEEIELDNDEEEEETAKQVEEPKAKGKKTVKREASKLPYNPEANPNTAEGWSDNPSDYLS